MNEQKANIEASNLEELRQSNVRLEALLRETNHRVANSLQLVSSVVYTQERTLRDLAAKTALIDIRCRIQAIGQLHHLLCFDPGTETVAMSDYLALLVAELQETWSTPSAPRVLTLVSDLINLKAERAQILGVIVNELICNACKYAYPPNVAGEIRTTLCRECTQRFVLIVEDDGGGVPKHKAPHGAGMGGNMINVLAKSLRATLSYDPQHAGTRAILRAAD